RYGTSAFAQIFTLPAYEAVTVELWGIVGDGTEKEETSTEVTMSADLRNVRYDNAEYEYGDWLPKLQFHKDNKPEEAANVLLFFSGIKQTPYIS
ncbi:MAG: hypothetical protein IIW66_06440, partial [Bacteroidales bacterium]|nr:hypothetical protein [Bacteroidales bacterium]